LTILALEIVNKLFPFITFLLTFFTTYFILCTSNNSFKTSNILEVYALFNHREAKDLNMRQIVANESKLDHFED
jgi:hypothetical protein